MKYFQNEISRQTQKILATENIAQNESLGGSESCVMIFLMFKATKLT